MGCQMSMSDDAGKRLADAGLSVVILRRWIEHRRSLAERLHDGCQQDLSILALEIGRLAASLDEADRTSAALEDVAVQVTRVQEEVRAVTIDLFPPALSTKGLIEALHAERRRHSISVEVFAESALSVPDSIGPAIFFFCREVLLAVGSRRGRGAVLTLERSGSMADVRLALAVARDVAHEILTLVEPLATASGGSCALSTEVETPLIAAAWPIPRS